MSEDLKIYLLIFDSVDGELVLAAFDNEEAAKTSYDAVKSCKPNEWDEIEATINTTLVKIPVEDLERVLYVKEFSLRSFPCPVAEEDTSYVPEKFD